MVTNQLNPDEQPGEDYLAKRSAYAGRMNTISGLTEFTYG
jgi:hypothetical protein